MIRALGGWIEKEREREVSVDVGLYLCMSSLPSIVWGNRGRTVVVYEIRDADAEERGLEA